METIWAGHFLVAKFGSDLVVRDGINWNFLESIAMQTASLRMSGMQTILVGSGARALGECLLGGLATRRKILYEGQRKLFESWRSAFDKFDIEVCELLLTGEDLNQEDFVARYILERTRNNRIMLINGDDGLNKECMANYKVAANNDLLAAYVAKATRADRLVLLTNVDGVYGVDGQVVQRISSQEQLDRDVIFRGKSKNGTGSMQTKVASALGFAVLSAQKSAFIANGETEDIVQRVLSGEQIGTRIQVYE